VEVFIEEGFLSYDDLTFLEPAQLAELAGSTPEQAEEMIMYAEEAAQRVEVEAKSTKAERMIEGELQAAAPAPARTGDARMDELFPTLAEQPVATEAAPTAESVLGPAPEEPAPVETAPAQEEQQ